MYTQLALPREEVEGESRRVGPIREGVNLDTITTKSGDAIIIDQVSSIRQGRADKDMANSFRVSSTEPTIFTPVHWGPARATIDHGKATRRRQVFRKQ